MALDIDVINVNDAPTEINLSNSSIDENESEGSVIGALSAVDEDTSESHSFTVHHDIVFETNGFNYLVKIDDEYLSGNNPQIEIIDLMSTYTISHEGTSSSCTWNSSTSFESPIVTLTGDSYELDTSEISESGLQYQCIYHSSMANTIIELSTDVAKFKIVGANLVSAKKFNYESFAQHSVKLKKLKMQAIIFAIKSKTISINDLNDPVSLQELNSIVVRGTNSHTINKKNYITDEDTNDTKSWAFDW